MEEEIVERLNTNPDFREFIKFVAKEIDVVSNLDGLDKLNNAEAGEEAKVRLYTKNKLYKILEPFIGTSKKNNYKAKLSQVKNKHGLT